ncbi:MAG TPA: 2Fe-2S iron-sulfur cluster-binding protein [Gammaproteobacteria bacterium]
MSSIVINDQRYPLAPGATVLETLLNAGVEVPFGCRAGACQSCLLRAIAGTVPVEAQQGLKETLKAEGWFLACRCQPIDELTIDLNAQNAPPFKGRVVEKRLLSPRVMGVWLRPERPFDYRAGQYLTLWRDENHGRSYSLASLPGEDPLLELHIARIDGGAVSGWVHDGLQVGDELPLQGPLGECFYVAGDPHQPLLLVGTGTGLAPLYGVLRDALRNGHLGPIHLFHGARSRDYLYYHAELTALSAQHANVHYHPSLVESAEQPAEGVELGPVDQLIARHLPALNGVRVYLSGAPDIVAKLRKQCFLAGAASKEIHTDPFG